MPYVASRDLVPGVLAGDIRSVARLLSRAEAGTEEARDALDAMWARAGRAHVVGITGVPGSGKSTLVTRLALAIRASGRRLAIVAIDPSSPFSGGAILGDRIRMGELGGDPGVFVRSMATRGALGGLARGTLEAVDVLDAAGYDIVLIETVGVGQDEVDIARAAHTTVVVSAPGLGDDIQAIKAGILEIADIHAVSKCDRPDANRTLAELKNMLAMGVVKVGSETIFSRDGADRDATMKVVSDPTFPAWRAPVIATSSVRDEGIATLLAAIDQHRAALDASGEMAARRTAIAERRMLRAGDELLRDHFARHRDGAVALLLHQLDSRALSPHAAARRLLRELNLGGES